MKIENLDELHSFKPKLVRINNHGKIINRNRWLNFLSQMVKNGLMKNPRPQNLRVKIKHHEMDFKIDT
jgi:hypothetical protein